MGLQEVTRDGFSYEMDLVFEITNDNHLATSSKDRTGLFTDVPEFLISEDTGGILRDWASKGRSELDDALDIIRTTTDLDSLQAVHSSYINLHKNADYLTAIKNKKVEITNNK